MSDAKILQPFFSHSVQLSIKIIWNRTGIMNAVNRWFYDVSNQYPKYVTDEVQEELKRLQAAGR